MLTFFQVLTIGTLVSFTQYAGLERKTGVVLKHFPDENQTLIIEIKTRKRHTVSHFTNLKKNIFKERMIGERKTIILHISSINAKLMLNPC